MKIEPIPIPIKEDISLVGWLAGISTQGSYQESI